MSAFTKIGWTDHSFNIRWGCERVSEECDNCYAADWAKRLGFDVWDGVGPYRTFGDTHWQQPADFERIAEDEGRNQLVFCSSMADVFDKKGGTEELVRLWSEIRASRRLRWQLLTKRPKLIREMLPADLLGDPRIWLGTTAGLNKTFRARVPMLRDTPAAVRFISIEPLLEPLNINASDLDGIDQLIIGGESGPKSRFFDPAWIQPLIEIGREAGCAIYIKQLGTIWARSVGAKNRKGENPIEWPADLRIQERPEVA